MSGINLSHVTYHYKNQSLFTGIDLSIRKGSITCLIGPNGSGKSTLLQLLAGLITPIKGLVTLDDKPIKFYSRKKLAKKLGFLPQQSKIPASLTVHEYVALARFCHHSWFKSMNEKCYEAVDEAIRLTDLESHAHHAVNRLSVGQKQRAKIALMLAQEPDYLLLDEPMAGLDLKQQLNIVRLLTNLQKNHGKTIIVILHDLHQAVELANEVVLLKEGCIMGQGDPKQLIKPDFLFNVFDFEYANSANTTNVYSFLS